MRTVTVKIKIYKFGELSEKAQEKAINDFITFLLESDYNSLSPSVRKAIDKAESMKTPWFAGEYIFDYAKKEVMDQVKDYEYLSSGEVYYKK